VTCVRRAHLLSVLCCFTGRGPSIWDMFMTGDNGDVTSDGYHHYQEDVTLIKSLKVRIC